jgi:hypothetical protein
MVDAPASSEFCSNPHIAPFSDVIAAEDLIWAMTSSGSSCIDMALWARHPVPASTAGRWLTCAERVK